MQSLLQTFWGVFSAENAQQNLSLFAGKEGENVAADVVTIVDDPLMKGGLATSAFDGEGSASRTKKVVDSGKLTTLLHDRKTARKQGVHRPAMPRAWVDASWLRRRTCTLPQARSRWMN